MKLNNTGKLFITFALSTSLMACYVVPVQTVPPGAVPNAQIKAVPLSMNARLYPVNERATSYGTVNALITNDLNGRGHFSVRLGSEYFQGEATRSPGSYKGVANAIGQNGNYLNCQYEMNNPSLGSGQCQHTDGAQFTLHIGS